MNEENRIKSLIKKYGNEKYVHPKRKKTKKCPICGKTFEVFGTRKFCDKNCSKIGQEITRRERDQWKGEYSWWLSMEDWKWRKKENEK